MSYVVVQWATVRSCQHAAAYNADEPAARWRRFFGIEDVEAKAPFVS